MEFHPSKIPIMKEFQVMDEKSATEAAEEMVKLGFSDIEGGYRVLMPKESRTGKRIGYTVTTTVNYGLRQTKQERNIRYWTYHENDQYYAIVLINANVLEKLSF